VRTTFWGNWRRRETRKSSLLRRLSWSPSVSWSLGLTALFLVSILLLDASKRFLYFQF